jgi:hypothetical protein
MILKIHPDSCYKSDTQTIEYASGCDVISYLG